MFQLAVIGIIPAPYAGGATHDTQLCGRCALSRNGISRTGRLISELHSKGRLQVIKSAFFDHGHWLLMLRVVTEYYWRPEILLRPREGGGLIEHQHGEGGASDQPFGYPSTPITSSSYRDRHAR